MSNDGCGVGNRRSDVFPCQARIGAKKILFPAALCEFTQNKRNWNTRPTDNRLAQHHVRVDRYAFSNRHDLPHTDTYYPAGFATGIILAPIPLPHRSYDSRGRLCPWWRRVGEEIRAPDPRITNASLGDLPSGDQIAPLDTDVRCLSASSRMSRVLLCSSSTTHPRRPSIGNSDNDFLTQHLSRARNRVQGYRHILRI